MEARKSDFRRSWFGLRRAVSLSDDEVRPKAVRRLQEPQPVAAEHAVLTPDLLHPRPSITIDHGPWSEALRFAFVAGDSDHALSGALESASVAHSSWQPPSFADGLFLSELVTQCMAKDAQGGEVVRHRAWLLRLLTHPPQDPEITAFRRTILTQLVDSPQLADELRQVHGHLQAIREAFAVDEPSRGLESRRRRLRILTCVYQAIVYFGQAFAGAHSGLQRIFAFGQHLQTTPPFVVLQHLLDFENRRASVDVRLAVGVDGRVRKLEFLHIEAQQAALAVLEQARGHIPQWRRGWLRWRAWFSGYRVYEQNVVEQCLDVVFEELLTPLLAMLQLQGDVEFYRAALTFRERCMAHGLAVCLPELATVDQTRVDVDYTGLFNPLLFVQGRIPVVCDLRFDTAISATILTGPNSGGKTRLLQALGMVQLLAQIGFFVPARAARLPWVESLFVSLIEDVQVDQKEGRLGTELLRIRQLFEQARPGSLILLDELCSGTNPDEGEEIFRLVLSLLRELGAKVMVATHFLDFARRLQADPNLPHLGFLQVELDAADLPTYRFVDGVAKCALAKQLAQRLGVTRDELLALVVAKRRDITAFH